MRNILLLVPVLLLMGCPPSPNPPYAKADCAKAQTNLDKVCPTKAKTPAGKPYAALCEEYMQKGIDLNPSCAAAVTSCEEFDKCPQR